MLLRLCMFGLSMDEIESRRADSNRLPLLQLRVITQALQGCAGGCKHRIFRGVSFPRLAACCTVLRSRWYQSGINIALVSTYPRRSPDLSSQSCRPSGLESPAQTAVAGRRSNPVSSDLTMTGTPG